MVGHTSSPSSLRGRHGRILKFDTSLESLMRLDLETKFKKELRIVLTRVFA